MTCTTTCIQPSPSQAHCGACHITFGGISGFDRHRRDDECLTPAAIGYTDNGNGVHRAPMSDAGRERLAALRTAQTPEPAPLVPAPTPAPSEAAETISDGWRWEPDGNCGWISAPRHNDGTHCWTGPDCIQEHA